VRDIGGVWLRCPEVGFSNHAGGKRVSRNSAAASFEVRQDGTKPVPLEFLDACLPALEAIMVRLWRRAPTARHVTMDDGQRSSDEFLSTGIAGHDKELVD